jgi:hypothetical protein
MAVTDLSALSNQIQKKWSPLFSKELRESLLLGSLVNKDYEGAIGKQGDTVYVSQLSAPTGQLKTVGTDADTFDSEQMVWDRVEIKADKRAVASFEVTDLAQLQSQLDDPAAQSQMRDALRFAVEKQINDYLWSLVNPSTASPNHLITSQASIGASELAAYRTLAAKAKWLKDGKWYGLLNPDYYEDILLAQTLTSKDYVDGQSVVVGGQVANERYGFKLLEDNSRNSAKGLFFHPDFMHMVMQSEAQFKISDLHSQKKFAYLVSVDIIFGAKLGIDGDKKHIYVTSGATLDPSA